MIERFTMILNFQTVISFRESKSIKKKITNLKIQSNNDNIDQDANLVIQYIVGDGGGGGGGRLSGRVMRDWRRSL